MVHYPLSKAYCKLCFYNFTYKYLIEDSICNRCFCISKHIGYLAQDWLCTQCSTNTFICCFQPGYYIIQIQRMLFIFSMHCGNISTMRMGVVNKTKCNGIKY